MFKLKKIITYLLKKTFLSLLFFVTSILMCSYAQSNKLQLNNRADGYYLVKKHKSGNSDSAYLDIEVLQAYPGKHSKLHRYCRISDVWLNDYRYGCDSAGRVTIAVKPGNIELTARSLGFKSISHTANVKKGEIIVIKYFLSYFKNYERIPKRGDKRRSLKNVSLSAYKEV